MAREIVLSNGMICLVSPCDFEWLSAWKWTATKSNVKRDRNGTPKFYAARWEKTDTYYRVKKGKAKGKLRKRQRKIYMHRQIAGTRSHHVTDHLDGNGLNNTRENLRNCTQSTNAKNRKELVHAGIDRSDDWG